MLSYECWGIIASYYYGVVHYRIEEYNARLNLICTPILISFVVKFHSVEA